MATTQAAATHYTDYISREPGGVLSVDGVDCISLAERYGTPLFVIAERQIFANVSRFARAFGSRYPDVKVLFATKANNNLAVRRLFTLAGAGGDAFGYGELLVTLAAGTPPEDVVLNGFVKTDRELQLAIDRGVTIHLDAPDELSRVATMARKAGRRARLGIRTRLLLHSLDGIRTDWPEAGADTEADSIGRNMREKDKFGISPSVALEVCKEAVREDSVQLLGLHHHIGRELADATLFEKTVSEQLEFAAELRDACGWVPQYLDFGGGMAFGRPEGHGPSGIDRDVPSYDDYAEVITGSLRRGLREYDLGEPRLLLEPGRALASNIGLLISTVMARKDVPETDQIWLGLDASQNHLLNSQSGGFYYHPVEVADNDAELESVNLADPQCWYGNLALDQPLRSTKVGGLIAFLDTGAYCETKALNYNLATRPATVLVKDGGAEMITERESLEQVIQRMRVPERLRCDAMSTPGIGQVLS
jgi:diaminopimelate decarboxylase